MLPVHADAIWPDHQRQHVFYRQGHQKSLLLNCKKEHVTFYMGFKQGELKMNKSFFIKKITCQSHLNMKSNVAYKRKKQNKTKQDKTKTTIFDR